MDRKEKKQETKKTKPATRRKQAKTVKKTAGSRAAKKIETELAQADEKLHKISDLLGDLPQGICFFNKDEVIKYYNDSFAVITGCAPDILKGKKLRKNQLWGGRGQKDEFKELFQQAREAGSPLAVDMLAVNSSKVGERTWNLRLIPQKDETGDYYGMELIIDDVTGKKTALDERLTDALYAAATLHTEIQPLLNNIVSILKHYTGCSSIQIVTVERVRDRSFKADTDNRAGLWDSDRLLSATEVNSIFSNAGELPEEYRRSGGSIYLNKISESEERLAGILRDIVVNSSNSHGFCSMAFIPIRFEDWIRGFIQIANTRTEVRPETVSMIENISNQLIVILEHIDLKDEMRTQREGLLKQMNERNAHLEAVSEQLRQEIAERKKDQEEMRVQRDLALALNEIDDLDRALELCLDTAIRVTGMDCGGIYLVNGSTGDLALVSSRGISDEFREKASRYDSDSMNMRLVSPGNPVYSTSSELEGALADRLRREGIKVAGFVPIRHDNNMVAVINIASHEVSEISYIARNAVEAIATEIGTVLTCIQKRRAYAESEERYKTLFARTSNPILVVDEEGNYIDGNDAALAFLECSREELLAMNVKDTLPPYLDDEWFEKYRAVWPDSSTVERDYYVWGKIKVLEIIITPLQMGDHKVFFGIGKDVTEKKRIENELRKSEEKYRSHFNNVNDVIYSTDTDLKITDISPSVERILGYKPEEITGKTVEELLFIDQPNREKALANIQRIFNGETVKASEYKFIAKNGDIVYGEISGAPLYHDGKVIGAISVARDVTDHRKAEEAVRKSEQKYRTILEEMDESYYEIDADGNFIDANEAIARRFGYKREEFIGLNYKDVTRVEDVSSKVAAFSRVFQTGRPRFWQPVVGVKQDGTFLYLEDSIYPLRNEKGEIIGLRGIGRDVTERRLWEAALKESEEKFRRLFFQSPVGVAIVSLDDYRFMSVNEALCNFSGYTDEELATLTIRNITHPDYIDSDIENIERLVKGEIDNYVTDKKYIRKDGSSIWGQVSVRLIKDPEGNPLYLLPVIEDITGRKKAEQELQKSETMFKKMVEHITDIFYIQNTDRELLYISPHVESLLGYSVDEMMGGWEKYMTDNPMNLQGKEKSQRAFSTGEKQEPYLLEFISRSGKVCIAEINESPLKDDQGNVTGMVGAARDVTSQHEAEDEIRASEERYHALAHYNQKLNEIYLSLTEASSSKALMKGIAESLKSLTGATAVAVLKYNTKAGTLRMELFSAGEELQQKAREILDDRLYELEFNVPAEVKEQMLNGVIFRPENFNEILFGTITPQQSDGIMAAAGCSGIVGLPLSYGYELAGTALALLPAEAAEVPDNVLKTFSYMAGLAIFKSLREEDLKASESRFKNIVEHINEFFYMHDTNYSFTYISPQIETMTGYTAEEAGQHLLSAITDNPINLEGRRATGRALKTGQKQPPYMMEILTRAGTKILIEYNETPLKDGQGNVTGMVGVARDVTQSKAMEHALIESEARFRDIIEASPDPIWEVDASGNFTYMSSRLLESMAYEPAEVLGKPFLSIIRPDRVDEVAQKFLEAQQTDLPVYTTQVDAVTKNGSDIILEIRVAKVLDNQGNLEGFRGISHDVTDRITFEKALLESEGKYRSVVEGANEGIFVLQDGQFKYANDRLINFSSYTREELKPIIGQDAFRAIVHPDDLEMVTRMYSKRMRGEEVPNQYEVRWLDKGGEVKWASINVASFTWEGKTASLGFVTDVTEQKKIEKALAANEEKYSTVLAEMQEFYYELDPAGNFTFINEAAEPIFGYTVEELIGMNYKVYSPAGHSSQRVEAFAEVFRTGKSRYYQPLENIRKDGSRVIIETSILPLRNDQGEIVGLRGVGRDITARIRAEEELQKRSLLLDSAYDSIIACNLDGNIIYANESACNSRGYTREEMLQMNVRNLVPEDGLSRLEERLGKINQQGELIFEVTHIDKEGAVFPVEAYSRLINTEDRGIIIAVYRDITLRKQSEQALKDSEARFRDLADMLPLVVFEVDPQGKLTYINKRALESFGYTSDEMLNNFPVFNLLEDSCVSAAKNDVQHILEGGETHAQEYILFRKDGSKFEGVVYSNRIMDGDDVRGIRCVLVDISSLKRAEQILSESEEKYRSVVENADEAIYIVQDGKLTYANGRAAELTGYSLQELTAKPFTEFIHPDDRDMVKQRYLARLNGDSVPDYYTFRIISREGAVKSVGLRATVIQWEGRPATLNFSTDVTEILKADNALKENEGRYRLLADNSMDIIVTASMDMEITYISPSIRYMIGRTAEDILTMYREGKLSAEVLGLSQADADSAVKGIRALVKEPSRTQLFELGFKHRDGFTSWAEVKMSVMREKSGQAAGILGVIRDITQQKKMTERLIRSDRLASLGEMAAGLAHEVNNPLTAVMGFAYLVLQNPNMPPEVKNDINSIYNEGKRAADVIKNFLVFARGRKPERQAVFINDIIESTLKLRHDQMTKENITVLLNLADDLPAINGDVSQLQQVFLNIILNAEHFMYQANKKGTLAITTLREEGRIKISIADDGPGIQPDKVGRVFDPFYTTKQVGEGTGLGLSICHGIISEHGGNIYAESQQGGGATFIIDLPDGN